MLVYALFIAATMSSHGSQRARPVRVFQYDPAQMEEFMRSMNGKTAPVETAVVETTESKPGSKPTNPPSYVNISGNFGGVFYVSGVGQGSSQTQTNFVNITTNRALTFAANSFKPLALGNTSEASMGTITYSMALYQGTSSHVGALVSGPVGGIDASFNGQTVGLLANQVPTTGTYVLVISRTLTVTGNATGANTLVGTGYIGVTIN